MLFRSNSEVAARAGVAVNRGIVVDDHLETDKPDVFAVGECAEHRGICYGLVEPAYEQAADPAPAASEEEPADTARPPAAPVR